VLASKVALRRLDADVPKQELDLVQLASVFVAEASACATKVVRCDTTEVAGRASLLHNAPDDLGTETVGGNPSRFVDRAKDWAVVSGRRQLKTASIVDRIAE
jgi:hypothetical protein